jgi:ketosteroid isomerase-like protein
MMAFLRQERHRTVRLSSRACLLREGSVHSAAEYMGFFAAKNAAQVDKRMESGGIVKYLLGMLLLGSVAYAAPCPMAQVKDGSALVEAEQTWARSLEHQDAVTLGCILADEFEDAGPDGKLTDRATTLAKAAEHRAVHHELSDLHPHVQGEFGYIRGQAAAVDAKGKTVAQVRFTDVYVYRDGRWQCVAGHESMMTAGDH